MTSSVGANLRRIRHERGLSQTGLAQRARMWTAHIQAIENGRIQQPRSSTMVILADALECSLDDLVREPSAA